MIALLMVGHFAFPQTIEGLVIDQIDESPLIGANLKIPYLNLQTVADQEGKFKFDKVPPGTYIMTASFVGFKPLQQKNIWVKNGKVTFVTFELEQSSRELDEVTIQSSSIEQVSSIQITEEKTNRLAGTYFDPARLATTSANATVTNDQNNAISVRGLPPSLNSWRIEGLEIVNPNHLTGAGIFNDQPAGTSGGVNILSAQVLDQSQFLYGHMNSNYTNASAGVFDMKMRNGYSGDHQFTAQASFIGFDLSAEGPLTSKQKASYLVNYRYSFTGLLANMGVDFGGEKIGFQDLSATVNLPLKKGADLKFFTFGGVSFNDFEHKTLEESEIEKDRKDIFYDGKMGAVGAVYDQPIGKKTVFTLKSAYSRSFDERKESFYDDTNLQDSLFNTRFEYEILANRIKLFHHLGNHSLEYGQTVNLYTRKENLLTSYSIRNFFKHEYYSTFLTWNWNIFKNFDLELGSSYNTLRYDRSERTQNKNESWVEPRIKADYKINKISFSIGTGIYNSTLTPGFLTINDNFQRAFNSNYRATSRSFSSIGYNLDRLAFSLEAFNYNYFDQDFKSNGVSFKANYTTPLIYSNVEATLFKAERISKDIYPYDIEQSYSFLLGKKWNYDNSRTLSINTRGIYQGGMYPEASNGFYRNNIETQDRLTPYVRLDLRIQWIRHRPKATTSWSLDIQNVTNRKNEAFEYLDSFTNQKETQYQLGMIPILAYRVEF